MDQYFSTLLSLDQSPTTLAMLGICLDFCTAQKDKETIEKHKVSSFFYLTESQVAVFDTTIISLVSVFLLFISECPVGPVHKISPHEQDKTTAAHSGQKWLPAASRVSLGVQGAAPPHTAEDDASQSRERHSQ